MILFTSDLLFGSKILGAAKFAGLRGQGVRNRAGFTQHAALASHYFLDLEAELAEGESPEELLDAALGHPHLAVYVFAGHMQAGKLRAAQAKIAAASSSATANAQRMEGSATPTPSREVHSRGSLSSRLPLILPPRTVENA
ncbi:MAG: hypothetical protein RL591_623 [Planctomycetota bacterium]|jgi:hypothetical protein